MLAMAAWVPAGDVHLLPVGHPPGGGEVAAVHRAAAGSLQPELEEVVEPLADARLALEGGSDAGPYLRRAAETLEDLLTRAGLLT